MSATERIEPINEPLTRSLFTEHADLLGTTVQQQYKKDPVHQRALRFIKTEFSPFKLIPSLTWFPEYVRGGWRQNLYGDVFAGLTVGAFLIPQGMSYALVAELPPVYGLYTACFPLIVYALFGTSRELSVGPVAIVSLLIGHGVKEIVPAKLADGKTANPEFISLCIAASLLSGLLQLGFTFASGIIIAVSQLKHVLGYKLSDDTNTFVVIVDMLSHLGQTHWPSLLLGLGVIAFLLVFKYTKRLKKLPSSMMAVVLSILISWGGKFAEKGIKVAGSIPAGIPKPVIPQLPSSEHMGELVQLVFILSLLGYMEGIVVGITYASKNRYKIVPNQELVAFGAVNIVGSFFQCYPAAGGFGRSSINADSGAKSLLAGFISGFVVMIVLGALTPFFYHLPKPALGAIVIVAMIGLMEYNEPLHLYKTRAWGDLTANLVTFFGTLLFGTELGIGLGVGASVLMLIYQASLPAYTLLGNIPGTQAYHDIKVMRNAVTPPGLLIIRFDADLWFANCTLFKEAVLNEARDFVGLKRVILDFSGVNLIDSSALHALHEIVRETRKLTASQRTALCVAGSKRKVRAKLLQEFCTSSYVSTGTHRARMVAGRTPAQIKALFERQEGALDGFIHRDAAMKLIQSMIHKKKKKDAKPEGPTAVAMEEGVASAMIGFPEFVEILKAESGIEKDDDIVLYSNVHIAVEDEGQFGEDPTPEGVEGLQADDRDDVFEISVDVSEATVGSSGGHTHT